MRASRVIPIFLIVLVALGFSAWYFTRPDGEAEARGRGPGGPTPVQVAPVKIQPMPRLLEAEGAVEPAASVAVRPQVNGTLQAVHFREGDRVRAGQILFEIDPASFQAAVDQARAAVARDQAQAAEARAQERRLSSLLEKEYVSRQEYAQAAAQAKAAGATVAANQAALKAAEVQLERSRIRSPIAGRTGSLRVKQGNLVTTTSTDPLVVINGIEPVLVGFSIPQQRLAEVRDRARAGTLTVEVGRSRQQAPVARGELVFIDNAVDPLTGTVRLKARVDNRDEALWPGEFVTARLILAVEPRAVVVPEGAVQPGQQGPYVYVVDQGKARLQTISVAGQVEGAVMVDQGLAGNEQVVVQPPQNLRPGAPVRPLTEQELRGPSRPAAGRT